MSTPEAGCVAIILVVNDEEETRDAIVKLLTVDGYFVEAARNEADAVEQASRQAPDLILITMSGPLDEMIASASRIRQDAGVDEKVPAIVFCVPILDEGAEVAIDNNVYVTRPDNFNQLRAFIYRLLLKSMMVV